MRKLEVREDAFRDGIAASFLRDGPLMYYAAKTIQKGVLHLGYPAICPDEYDKIVDILSYLSKKEKELKDIEFVLVTHTRDDHIKLAAEIITKFEESNLKLSINPWIPVSSSFIRETFKTTPEDVLDKALHLVKKYKDFVFDFALADTTVDEKGLVDRIAYFSDKLYNNGVRSIIIADSKGIGTPDKVKSIFESLVNVRKKYNNKLIEFHPHNDNGLAINNIKAVYNYLDRICTSFYHISERKNMLDIRDLVNNNINVYFDENYFKKFDKLYFETIGDPYKINNILFGENKVVTGVHYRFEKSHNNIKNKKVLVTGTQYRLHKPLEVDFIFGVTTDTFMLSQFLYPDLENKSKKEKRELLFYFKHLLYKNHKIYFTKEELIKEYHKLLENGFGDYESRKGFLD